MKIILLCCLLFSQNLFAKLNVVSTLSDLNAIISEVGGEEVQAESFCKGSQDPHYLEPKPSYMMKASQADLVVAIGLGLEIGWLPSILQGSRNPKIQKGQPGYLEVGTQLNPIEVAGGKVSRAEGDVHPEGNPHVTLDPTRVGEIAILVGKKLGELDSVNKDKYASRALGLQKRLEEKTKLWQARIAASQVKKVVSFHKTLTYFFNRFQIENPLILEPLPGIPPTAKHILEVIKRTREEKIPLILVENFFDPSVAEKVAKEVQGVKAITVAVAVNGDPSIKTIDDLYEQLVQAIEGKLKNG